MFEQRQSAAWGFATAALVIGVCAGCATSSAVPSGPHTGVVSSGPLPDPTGSLTPSPNQVSPEPAVDLHRERWAAVTPVPGVAALAVHGTLSGGPPCAVLGRVDVEERTDQVVVTVWVGRRPDADCSGPQPDLGFPYVTTVSLHEPLGRRSVRDGAA